ncbi:group II intron reverse transcriptase/maturase [bacterium]|nr:group II intron reverse transcriptase/maturase [bacterium]
MSRVYYSFYDRLLSKKSLYRAFCKVKSNRGSYGVDKVSIDDFENKLKENILRLLEELKTKSYKPQAVRKVEIPKENGKTRQLGIPTIRDRVVQQTLLEILSPIYEEDFHPSSYGYRPNRSCHQAISKATMFIRKYNLKWVVDMDLSKCFDTLNHEIIISTIRKRVTDGSILKLIEMFLKSGIMRGAGIEKMETGSPQGGVISPLIANIYLNEFDQYMKRRNYRIVRYADDILILCRTKRKAEKAREEAARYLEKILRLKVNEEKTYIRHSDDGIKYLGVEIYSKYTKIQEKKLKKFKEKVKSATRRNSPVNLEKVIKDINPILRGFINYFKIANCKKAAERLMEWTRRRLRAKQLKLWKTPNRLRRRLRQLGCNIEVKEIKMSSWKNSKSQLASLSMPNNWFSELGLFDMTNVKFGITVPC